jgi:hypothetical protein
MNQGPWVANVGGAYKEEPLLLMAIFVFTNSCNSQSQKHSTRFSTNWILHKN